MEDKIHNLLSFCSEIDFGAINLTDGEKAFYKEFNDEIFFLCKSLPESTQTDALLHFLRYSGIAFGDEIDFFKNYYVPSWSLVYWLIQSCFDDKRLSQEDRKNATKAHAMAMILHSLDDHLNDNEIPATHLTLLIRSQAWMIMSISLKSLTTSINEGKKIVEVFLDNYYSSICSTAETESLDRYCELFRNQMATGFIVPALLARRITSDKELARSTEAAFGSFGIAWRLLDDLKDIESDMKKCIRSSIYVCLPKKMKYYWDNHIGKEPSIKSDYFNIVVDYLIENGVIDLIKERICIELEAAASIAGNNCKTKELAEEYRCLLRPLLSNWKSLQTGPKEIENCDA